MKEKYYLVLLIMTFLSPLAYAHEGGHLGNNEKREWQPEGGQTPFTASYLLYKEGFVFLEDGAGAVQKYPLLLLSERDRKYILAKDAHIHQLNKENLRIPVRKESENYISWLVCGALSGIGIYFLVLLRSRGNKPTILGSAVGALVFFSVVLISCSEETDGKNPTGKDVPKNDESFMSSLFRKFKNVTTTADANYLYVSSTGFPEHNMMEGITSWQQQVPIPQDYTGSNAWAIPLKPELADNPVSTEKHLLKGAIAIAVNGIPIFNPLNNRGDDAKAFGELDNWGGHCGKADDYHYHIPPTHLEAVVGEGKPIAYALDGFPVYGFTTKQLDEYLGILNDDGSYEYHTVTEFPYFMAGVRGKITLDPKTTAPEDQITPQAMSSPLRGGDYVPLSGAIITGFKSTGTNAYSLTYTISNQEYQVNYSWDANNIYTFNYKDAKGAIITETYKKK